MSNHNYYSEQNFEYPSYWYPNYYYYHTKAGGEGARVYFQPQQAHASICSVVIKGPHTTATAREKTVNIAARTAVGSWSVCTDSQNTYCLLGW